MAEMHQMCIICKATIEQAEHAGHALDPCALVVVGHADREHEDQKEQTFFCHFQCFRKIVSDDGLLYISDPDFSTNGEIDRCAD